MKALNSLFTLIYAAIILLFTIASVALLVFAGIEMWEALRPAPDVTLATRFGIILESIGLLTIAVAALDLGQTILEEEVQRNTHISMPTRVRRFLSRFMVVVIVSLSIEFLITTFKLSYDDPSKLLNAAAIGVATGVLLAAWGLFIRLNHSAEELEPASMEQVQQEDRALAKDK